MENGNRNLTRLSNLRPWKPGQSGNPLGRRSDKSLVDRVLKDTENGAELGSILLDIARHGRRDTDRIEAASILLDRCFGKLPTVDHASLFSNLLGGEIKFAGSFGGSFQNRTDADGDASDAAVEVEAQRVEGDAATAPIAANSGDQPEIADLAETDQGGQIAQ